MWGDLLRNFFTHKDYLPERWYGTLFTPMQVIFCAAVAVGIAFACVACAKKSEAFQKRVFCVLWLLMLFSEPAIALYDVFAGKPGPVPWDSILPLWPCSIFLFVAPFAIFGKGAWKRAACGYTCTLGLLGGAVNFIYPATYLKHYSCLSMAGFRTVFYHGALVFIAVTMLLSGYHSFKGVKTWRQLLLPFVPALLVSVPANIVNFTVPGADYMFFRMEFAFFPAVKALLFGENPPALLPLLFVYALYGILHIALYLPSFLANRRKIPAVGAEGPACEEPAV